MFGYKETFTDLVMKDSPQKVRLGDDRPCSNKEKGTTSYKLISGRQLRMEDVLFIPKLKRNLLLISGLEKKGFRVAIGNGEVLIWPKGKTIEDVDVIGIHEDGLYKLIGKPAQALVHSTISPCELWHRRFSHLHYRTLPLASKAVKGLPEI